MTARKISPLHDKWHRRVEGQIRDCMSHHPNWFLGISDLDRPWFINSLAKRIVGEILADGQVAKTKAGEVGVNLASADGLECVSDMHSNVGDVAFECIPDGSQK